MDDPSIFPSPRDTACKTPLANSRGAPLMLVRQAALQNLLDPQSLEIYVLKLRDCKPRVNTENHEKTHIGDVRHGR